MQANFSSSIHNYFGKIKYVFTIAILTVSTSLFAQSASEKAGTSDLVIFSNSLFDTLLAVIVLLLIIIAVLSNVLKNVAEAVKEKRNNRSAMVIGGLVILFSLFNQNDLMAQTTAVVHKSVYGGLTPFLFYFMIGVIVFELAIVAVLINSIQYLLKKEIVEKAVVSGLPKVEVSFLEKMNASVAIEDENDILLDHNYDGIQELDNNLPPWWKYGFYVTIVFAFIYLINYHVVKSGDLQVAEYNKTILLANIAKVEYQKRSANNVNESNVAALIDKASLDEGATIYKENCVACHGKLGEGGVGPNLTDEYWIHGGGIKDLFSTIKYGWPDKGMKAWQADLPPVKINQVASYILTMKGTNPPNGKEPQGEIYKEQVIPTKDSTKIDSAATAIPIKENPNVVTK